LYEFGEVVKVWWDKYPHGTYYDGIIVGRGINKYGLIAYNVWIEQIQEVVQRGNLTLSKCPHPQLDNSHLPYWSDEEIVINNEKWEVPNMLVEEINPGDSLDKHVVMSLGFTEKEVFIEYKDKEVPIMKFPKGMEIENERVTKRFE